MDDLSKLKKAYETMDLPEFASREDVEKRYTLLLRRERSKPKQEDDEAAASSESGSEFSKVNEAYKFILAYEDRKITDAFNEQEYGKYKKMAGQAQKFDHFWRYYKFHTLGAIVLIAIIIYGVNAYMNHREHEKYLASLPPVDVSISFYGLFANMDQDQGDVEEYNNIDKAILETFPDWKRVKSSIVYVPQNEAEQYVYLQKAVVTLVSEKSDLYIVDKSMFQWIGQQGVFMNLDDKLTAEDGLSDDIAMKLSTEDVPEEHVYAVNLTNSKLADDLPVQKVDLIVGIRANAKNPDKALQFLKTYLKTAEKP
ncbi:J domain-containing protein [Paenibacillus sp. HB172176]|uniref:J domain-containing protein n=1 Tax=Paenibacillus sp. HB172176 TaxID=2493690 RepID=UPI00143AD6A7|nr:J domain-containing protein [Paenibacillus sp. HB172176]